MFEIYQIEVTPFSQVCRLLVNPDSREAVLVDPGGEAQRLLAWIKTKQARVRQVWITHSHLDHCGAVRGLAQELDFILYAHPAEAAFRSQVSQVAKVYSMPEGVMENCPEPERPLCGGETLKLGPDEFQVLFCPGHSPGHLCYYHPPGHLLLVGDCVFAGSIGRSDLPGGDARVLMNSIRSQILCLPKETRLLAGHGPDTTVAAELANNPYLDGVKVNESFT